MGLPLATALFGVGVGLAGGTLLTNVLDVPEWASSVATMIGLGVGIDYALLIVTRYRTELASGASPAQAVATAMATAGRSVVFAGITVVISLLGMLTMNQPYVPGVAFSAVVTVLAVMLAALTLLPALLGFTGRNIDRLRMPFRHPSAEHAGRGFWYRWSRIIQRRPVVTGARRCARPRRADRPGLRAASRVPRRRQRPDQPDHPPRLRPDDRRLRRRVQRHLRAGRRQR